MQGIDIHSEKLENKQFRGRNQNYHTSAKQNK